MPGEMLPSWPSQRSSFDVALICLNGHVVNMYSQTYPQYNEAFCARCGAETITNCPICNEPIRGKGLDSTVIGGESVAPMYCINCGSAYPWLQSWLDTADELIDEMEKLSDEDKEDLLSSTLDLLADTPKTEIAAYRFTRLVEQAGAPAGPLLYNLLVDVAPETAVTFLTGRLPQNPGRQKD